MSSDMETPLELESFVAISKAAQALESRELPHGADFHTVSNAFSTILVQFYMNSTYFKARVDAVATEALALLHQLPTQADETQTLSASEFTSEDVADDLESRLDYLYEVLDDTLASAAASVRRQQEEAEVVPGTLGPGDAAQTVAGSRAQNIAPNAYERSRTPKPQLQFEDGVDNSNRPWRPKYDGLPAEAAELRARAVAALESGAAPAHPLADVLGSLTYQPWQLAVDGEPVPPAGFEQTPFTFIDTPAALRQLAAQLEAAREIAVDLEAHSYRSFQGFTCLMQLSTRSADYIVDVIKLRSFIGPVLGPVFADPARVKVLHGADSDIVWLQRDFGIYVANLFDTGQATRVLQYPGHGLAYLLDRFCGFRADKRFQLADWRQRPLAEEMMGYARADTHYLLYIYDVLRTELLSVAASDVPAHLQVGGGNSTALGTVLERSRVLSLLQYTKDVPTETSFLRSAMKTDPPLNDMELAAYRALFDWRDKVGRREDESTGWVLPMAQLLSLARSMPSSVAELVNVLGRKSRYVQQRAKEVVQLIKAATTAERVREVAVLRRAFIEDAAERDEVQHGSSFKGYQHKFISSPQAKVEVLGSQPSETTAGPPTTTPTLPPNTSPLTSDGASARPFRPRSLKKSLPTGVSTGQGVPVTEQPPTQEDQGTVSRIDATNAAAAEAPAQPAIQQTATNVLPRRRRMAQPIQLAVSSRAFGGAGISTAPKGDTGSLLQERTAIVASIQASLALPFVAAVEAPMEPEVPAEDGAPASDIVHQEDDMQEEISIVPTTAMDVRAAMDEMHAATPAEQPLLPELDQGDYVPVPEESQQQRKRPKPSSAQRKRKGQASRQQKDFEPFDYGAAKHKFAGALPPAGAGTSGPDRNKRETSRGRGGKPGDRRGGKRGAQGGVFNPFQIKDANIKKGKQSSTVKNKSGNRSAHF